MKTEYRVFNQILGEKVKRHFNLYFKLLPSSASRWQSLPSMSAN